MLLGSVIFAVCWGGGKSRGNVQAWNSFIMCPSYVPGTLWNQDKTKQGLWYLLGQCWAHLGLETKDLLVAISKKGHFPLKDFVVALQGGQWIGGGRGGAGRLQGLP